MPQPSLDDLCAATSETLLMDHCRNFARWVKLSGTPAEAAWAKAKDEFQRYYSPREWTAEASAFDRLLHCDLKTLPETEIGSGGYVMDTLTLNKEAGLAAQNAAIGAVR